LDVVVSFVDYKDTCCKMMHGTCGMDGEHRRLGAESPIGGLGFYKALEACMTMPQDMPVILLWIFYLTVSSFLMTAPGVHPMEQHSLQKTVKQQA